MMSDRQKEYAEAVESGEITKLRGALVDFLSKASVRVIDKAVEGVRGWDDEEVLPTEQEKILVVKNSRLDIAIFREDIRQLERAINAGDFRKIQEELSRMCACHLGKASGYAPLPEKAVGEGS